MAETLDSSPRTGPGPDGLGGAPGGPEGGPAGDSVDRPAVTSRRWVRRAAIGLALVLAFAVLYVGTRRGDTSADNDLDPVVVAQFPAPGSRALRQTEIGAELVSGYDGRLVIDGIAIPEDQMEGAIDPRSVSAEDLARYGIRPNNRNRVFFKPAEGKVIEELRTGEVTIQLRYFRDRRDESTGRTITWTIQVS